MGTKVAEEHSKMLSWNTVGMVLGQSEDTLGGHFRKLWATPFGHFRDTLPQEPKCIFGASFGGNMTKLSPRRILTPGGKCPTDVLRVSKSPLLEHFGDALGHFEDILGGALWGH